jgi:EAL domain-containing protein (putative c-di-GMP-specific phosphodiesterase class I)
MCCSIAYAARSTYKISPHAQIRVHGSFFRDKLAHNQVSPNRVVIEILEQNIHDETILSAAVNYYKELGCLVALDDFGASLSGFDRILNIKPEVRKYKLNKRRFNSNRLQCGADSGILH